MRRDMSNYRPDQTGTHRRAFELNKKKIYASQTVCGICGRSVDFARKYPDPLSPCIDHIIPVSKGGHPSAMENLQLAHWSCNRKKADSLPGEKNAQPEAAKESSEELPWSIDWTKYKGA